jgi:hypothetical protein
MMLFVSTPARGSRKQYRAQNLCGIALTYPTALTDSSQSALRATSNSGFVFARAHVQKSGLHPILNFCHGLSQ